MSRLEVRDLTVGYEGGAVLHAVDVEVPHGELLAIVGPSGCGKTTLLRVIAGFVGYQGELIVDGRSYADVPAHRRNIGLVFQDYALFPHKTVADNIAFGLRLRGRSRAQIAVEDHALRCQTSLALAVALAVAGRPDDALLEAMDALARARQISSAAAASGAGPDDRAVRACLAFLAKLYTSVGRPEEGEKLRQASLP